MPRFSANLGFLWTDRPLIAAMEAAARAGFRAVEMHWPYATPPEEAAAAARRLGLAILGVNTARGDVARGDNGLGALKGREEEFQIAVDQALDWAARAGGTSVHAMAGVVRPADKAEATGVFADNLRRAAAKAEAQGLTLLLEPLSPRAAPGYFYSTAAEAVAMIARVGAPNIRLMFDVFHVASAEGDVLTKLERYKPWIGHVQIAAVPSRAEPDEGEIDYRAICEALDNLGYSGWVGAEYRPRAAVEDGLGWVERLGGRL